jgi:predicted ATPase
MAWLEAARSGRGEMLALIGKQGTGKSHLLYGAVRELYATKPEDPKAVIESRWCGPYVAPWYRLADELRYGKGGNDTMRDAQGERMRLWGARTVMLDEVRPTSGTNFDDTELAKFACHAYDNRVAVLITTNVNPLAEVMGEAAASRFTAVVVNGPDWRNPSERAA